MRIVHLAHAPLLPGHPDHGRVHIHPGRWVLNLAIAQQKHLGCEVHLVTQVPGATADWQCEVEGVQIHYLRAPDRLRAATLFYFDGLRLRRTVSPLQPDIVHAHGTEDAYALAAPACGVPSVLTAQGCYFVINRRLNPPFFSRARVIEFTESMAFRRTQNVIAKSAYIEEQLQTKFPHLVCHRIPNTFDESLLEISPSSREPGSIAFVGSFEYRKGLHLLYDALAGKSELAAKVTVHVFGAYSPDQQQPWYNLLGGRAVFHGVLPAGEVPRRVSQCEILVAPSLEEMFGNQVIESLLVGTPVVVTADTAMAENVERFGGGVIVPQGNPAALALAIERIFGLPPTREEMNAVRQKVIEAMGPRTVALAHGELYEKILRPQR